MDSPVRTGPRLVEEDEGPSSGRPSRVSRPSLVEGASIGKYTLVRRLGEGGMAEVWRAHDAALDVDVAIKFIRGDLEHPELADRLLQEARAAARLGHPAIVRVHDYGKTAAGVPFIAMELLEGETLASIIEQRGRLPATRAVKTLLPIAHALATAHAKGIVHRDLKPDNVFLVRSDDLFQPKLVDFGIAKLERADARITRMGTAIGSPGYMSPEQARGEDVDHRSDIWAFCVMLYEAVTGRLPFEAKTYNALLRSIIEDEPPSIRTFAAGDDALWEILLRGLEKNLDRRWASMRALGQALADWLLKQGTTEDIAGASLQATWITRATPSSAPPPMSGIRSTPATQGLPAFTPTPATQSAARAPAAAPRRSILLVAAIVVGIVVLGVGLALLLGSKPEPAPETPVAQPEESPPPPPVTQTAEAPKVEAKLPPPPAESAAPAPSASAAAPTPPPPAAARNPSPTPRPAPPPVAPKPKPEPDKPKPDSFELKTPF